MKVSKRCSPSRLLDMLGLKRCSRSDATLTFSLLCTCLFVSHKFKKVLLPPFEVVPVFAPADASPENGTILILFRFLIFFFF